MEKRLEIIVRSILVFVLLFGFSAIAQVNPVGQKLDESKLHLTAGSSLVDDQTADGGKAVLRPANSPGETVWFGPYIKYQAGNYVVQFRMKVSSNQSSNSLCILDIVSFSGGLISNSINLKPTMFRNQQEWEIISIPVVIAENVDNIEIRGVNFTPGITDLYLDYINIVPADIRGFYSNEFTITPGGSVGIGTINPTAKLTVAGNIQSREVRVSVDAGADYVFKEGYPLQPLSELEAFIKQNQRLPEIASAMEMEKEGVNLSEMNIKLLKKIEELTLYMIDMKKENEQLKARVTKIESRDEL
ncbi:hypothetical protein B0I27_11646 [Arcticibacter pallidicorallinus]|uniref:Uncharacterized protein n=1 Tax=Arcticibacter pallidicorallinus TaxID=1259464 RepID=A0A2T0TQV8_9SPHI|nr:hypothetical protein [Arcticibacter pallidicorallinus]PRY48112.1 hypothetical protein B0I27_11646 [Arcticibacter pallidicorallinus]